MGNRGILLLHFSLYDGREDQKREVKMRRYEEMQRAENNSPLEPPEENLVSSFNVKSLSSSKENAFDEAYMKNVSAVESRFVCENEGFSDFKLKKNFRTRKETSAVSFLPSVMLMLFSLFSLLSVTNSFVVPTIKRGGNYQQNIHHHVFKDLNYDSKSSNLNLSPKKYSPFGAPFGGYSGQQHILKGDKMKRYLDSPSSSSSAASSSSASATSSSAFVDMSKGDENNFSSNVDNLTPKATKEPQDQIKAGIYKLEKVQNIRDLSSVNDVKNKVKIKPGCIIRTGHLSGATENDRNFLRNEIKFKTLIDLRSEKEHHMDEDRDNQIYNGYESYYYNKKGQYLYKSSTPSNEEEKDLTNVSLLSSTPNDETQLMEEGEEDEGINEGVQKTEELDSTTKVSNQNRNRITSDSPIIGSRHFVSVIDESVYQKGVFRKLSKRQKAAALFLLTGGAVSKRAKRRGRSIFIKFINDKGLPLLNELLLNYATGPIKTILELLSEKENYPVGLYCTAGKDRTGLIVYLILAALGIDFDAIKEDYVLSDSAYADMNQKKAFVGALEQNNLDPEKFLIAPPYVIDDLRQHIDLKYGSVENYLDSIGFDETKREILKKNLLM